MRINGFVPSNEIFQSKFPEKNKINENSGGLSFTETLKTSLDEINSSQIKAENLTNSFIKGDDVDVAEVMLAGEEAKISLQYAVQVRNKLVEAYQEIIKMQL